jgi:Rod binding domain-containing protein
MSTAVDTSALTQSAMWQAQNAYASGEAARASGATKASANMDMGKVKEAAQKFEAFFVGQMMEYMMAGMKADTNFGGGQAEDTWKSMLNQEYGKEIAKSGKLGITDKVMKSMVEMQERKSAATAKLAQNYAAADAVIPEASVNQAAIAAGAAAQSSKLDITA